MEVDPQNDAGNQGNSGHHGQKGNTRFKKLFKKVEDSINMFDYKTARRHCQKILKMDPTNVRAIEMQAGIALECGDPDTAKDLWLQACELSPEDGHTKYFSLGQLNEGKEALECYNKGIALLQSRLGTNTDSEDEVKSLCNELSNAYCAMAELFMTDLCFEENAEQQCQHLIDKSIEADSSNPEAYVCLTNFLIVQGKTEEAKEAMNKSLSWLPAYQNAREGKVEDVDPVEVCPLSYDSRINMCKLLIELEMYSEASEILGGLMEEDDEVVECWYLLGWLNYLQGADYYGNARYYFNKAVKVAKKTQSFEEEMLQHIEELLEEIGQGSDDDESEGNGDKENAADEDDELETEDDEVEDEEMQ